MGGNQSIAKRDVSLFIVKRATSSHHVHVTLKSGKTFYFPLEWMVFGSKTSLDCDVIIKTNRAFVEEKPTPDIYNKMCEIFDMYMGSIIGSNRELTDVEVNSSVGYWNEGQILFAQKGSDLGEVNNSIMDTFDNHPKLQIYPSCPLTVRLKRDVWYKIQTTIRDILCKMNKSRYNNGLGEEAITHMHELLVNIFAIPEILAYTKSEKKKYVCPILQGVFIQRVTNVELCGIIPDCSKIINKITATAENKRKRLKPIDEVIDLMEKHLDPSDVIMKILRRNEKDGIRVIRIIEVLDDKRRFIPVERYEHLRKLLLDLIQSSVIHLNRVIRIVRHIQPLGVRMDLLRLLDMRNIKYLLPADAIATRYKDIAFKFGQAWALMDGVELYDKQKIAKYYESSFPDLGVFLRREDATIANLIGLNNFIRVFLDRVEGYLGYSRELKEEYRNQ